MPELNFIAVGEEDERLDAVQLADAVGILRSLALSFERIARTALGFDDGERAAHTVEQHVVGKSVLRFLFRLVTFADDSGSRAKTVLNAYARRTRPARASELVVDS